MEETSLAQLPLAAARPRFENLGYTCYIEVVKLLLANKADVNVTISHADKKFSALRIAKKHNHTQIVKLLKKHGANE